MTRLHSLFSPPEKREEKALYKTTLRVKTASLDWLPGCIGFYGKPVAPWSCEACPFGELCKGDSDG